VPCNTDGQVQAFGYHPTSGAVTRSKLTQKDTYNGQTVSRSLEADFLWIPQGAVARVTYPSGRLLDYNLDTGGRLDGLHQFENGTNSPETDLVTATSYNKAGQLLTMDFLDSVAVRETRTYDANTLQLTRIQADLLDLSYVYPAAGTNNGRITAETRTVSGTSTTASYTYDQVNRLATAASATGGTTNWGLSFSYDVYGSRTAQTVIPQGGTGLQRHVRQQQPHGRLFVRCERQPVDDPGRGRAGIRPGQSHDHLVGLGRRRDVSLPSLGLAGQQGFGDFRHVVPVRTGRAALERLRRR
jgi:hypothetical protein